STQVLLRREEMSIKSIALNWTSSSALTTVFPELPVCQLGRTVALVEKWLFRSEDGGSGNLPESPAVLSVRKFPFLEVPPVLELPAMIAIRVCVVLLAAFSNAYALPRIVIFTTGGTISGKYDPAKGGYLPALSGSDLVA